MPARTSLVTTLCLTSALALLTSVLATPIRTSGYATVLCRLDCLRQNFALPPGRPTARFSAAVATDAVPHVNALRPEEEEQDRADALDDPGDSFLIPCSFPKVPDGRLIAPRSILSLYPLRC